MEESKGLVILKFLVYAMGLLLFCGVIVLSTLIYQRISQSKATTATCEATVVTLPSHSKILNASLEKGSISLAVEKGAKDIEILTLEPCTGEIRRRLTLKISAN